MRLGYVMTYAEREHRRALAANARLAEECGWDGVWVPEAWGSDAVSLLGAVASRTSRIRLATGIVNVFSRTPGTLAQTFATLDELSGGRVVIGLGTSGSQVIERWHGMPFERPVRRLRETVEILRLALSGQRVDYDGEIFRLRGFTLPVRPIQSRIPIYLATFKPRGLRLTGEIADGWLPTHVPLAHLPELQSHVRAGAAAAGRDAASIDVAPLTLAAVTEPGDEARGLCARHLAYYIGGMGAFYHELMTRFGFGEEADRIVACWKQGDRDGASRQVSRAMLDALVIAGTPEQCLDRIERYRAAGIDHLPLMPPHGTPVEMVRATIRALSPAAVAAAPASS